MVVEKGKEDRRESSKKVEFQILFNKRFWTAAKDSESQQKITYATEGGYVHEDSLLPRTPHEIAGFHLNHTSSLPRFSPSPLSTY